TRFDCDWSSDVCSSDLLDADLAGDAGHLAREGGELVDHRVDRVLELGHLAPGLDGDLLGEVAAGDGGRHLGDVADLAGQVAGELVDVVGQRLPGARDPGHLRLAAEPSLDADLASAAGDPVGDRTELVDHLPTRLSPDLHLAPGLDGDLLGEVAAGDGGRHLGDVADLAGQVAGELVDVVGQVLPGAGDARHLGLPAELALGTHLAGDAGDLVGERGELVDHRVDRALELDDLAADLDHDLLREVAGGDRRGDLGDVADLVGEVGGSEDEGGRGI